MPAKTDQAVTVVETKADQWRIAWWRSMHAEAEAPYVNIAVQRRCTPSTAWEYHAVLRLEGERLMATLATAGMRYEELRTQGLAADLAWYEASKHALYLAAKDLAAIPADAAVT